MAHEFKLTGDLYFSKSGSNANPGTDPNNPKLTFGELANLSAYSSPEVIFGTGVYSGKNNPGLPDGSGSSLIYSIGDGLVIIEGDGLNPMWQTSNPAAGYKNLVFINHQGGLSDGGYRTGYFDNCIFINCLIRNRVNHDANSEVQFVNCKFINCSGDAEFAFAGDEGLPGGSGYFTEKRGVFGCIFINTNFGCNKIVNSYFNRNSTMTILTTGDPVVVKNNCVRGAVKIDGTSYADLADQITANPTYNTQSFDSNPLFLGNPNRLEFGVSEFSPLIGAGETGLNIGNVSIGNLQNKTSLEWGLNPQVTGNTAFDANSALTLTSGTASQRESREIDLGQLRNSPTVRLNGVFDALNNVPDDNNALANPNHLVFEAQWAGQDNVYNGSWEKFRYNEPMRVDGGGLYTGESGYDWSDENDIQIRYLKIRTGIRNNYNVA